MHGQNIKELGNYLPVGAALHHKIKHGKHESSDNSHWSAKWSISV